MVYIGIDPGKKGAYSIIGAGAEAHEWDDEAFARKMDKISERNCFAVVEHVGAMPGQGVTSMFSFGQSFGFILGVLTAFQIPFELVRPQKWKRAFSITGDKNNSIEVCKRLFPDVNLLRTPKCTKPSDGMAESLLMAEYARRIRPEYGVSDI